MRIFVYEYICASFTERPKAELPWVASLLSEGRAMLAAALEDCAAVPGAEVRTMLGTETAIDRAAASVEYVDSLQHEESIFRRLADWCDYALIIAPEFERILETRSHWAHECKATLLGPPPNVIALCADKLALAEVWEKAGVPTPPTKPFDPWAFPLPVVVKPRDGVGAVDTFRFTEEVNLHRYQPPRPAIIQPMVERGLSFSVSYLIGPDCSIALAPCNQNIEISTKDGSFHYHGGQTWSPARSICQAVVPRVHRLADAAVAAVPGLRGLIGVDLQLKPEAVFEINPRMTTSYIGLRKLTQSNLMEQLIRVVKGEECEPPLWRSSTIQFFADGTTDELS